MAALLCRVASQLVKMRGAGLLRPLAGALVSQSGACRISCPLTFPFGSFGGSWVAPLPCGSPYSRIVETEVLVSKVVCFIIDTRWGRMLDTECACRYQ